MLDEKGIREFKRELEDMKTKFDKANASGVKGADTVLAAAIGGISALEVILEDA